MSVIALPYTFSPNTTISSSQVNSNFTTIVNDYNGGIAAANLASNAVTTAKIADSNVTTAKIADDAITAAKLDWATTGGSGGIWWEEIGRHTLSSTADTLTVSSLPVRKYIRVMVKIIPSGSVTAKIRFNNDSGSNYDYRVSTDQGATATATSNSNLGLLSTATSNTKTAWFEFDNIADQFKLVAGHLVQTGGAIGNAPITRQLFGKWANAADAVSRVDVFNDDSGDYAAGTELVILGHN